MEVLLDAVVGIQEHFRALVAYLLGDAPEVVAGLLSVVWVIAVLSYILTSPPGNDVQTLGLVMTLLIAAAGVFLPMGPLAPYFKLQALPPLYFVWLVGLLCGYAALTQVMKTWYGRRFGWF